jgi:hypothetical protein
MSIELKYYNASVGKILRLQMGETGLKKFGTI